MLLRLILLLPVLVLRSVPAHGEVVRTERTEAELISDVAAVVPGESFDVALRLKPDSGWHTYWKNPGDSGAATTIRWKLPPGFTADEIRWPPPTRISIPPLMDFGYEDETFLVTRVTAPAGLGPGSEARIDASVRWLVCHEVCIPGRAELSLKLPVSARGPAPASRWKRTLDRVRETLPVPLQGWTVRARGQGDTVVLRMEPPPEESLALYREVSFFPDQLGIWDHAKLPPVDLQDGALEFRLPRAAGSDQAIDRVSGVLVVRRADEAGARTRSYQVESPLAKVSVTGETNLLQVLLFAFLGGVILNLMPCVFPVISMKVMSFAGKAGGARGAIRAHALFFALGVLVSFWVLAGALIAARAAGEGVGWGFQLQSPLFVTALAALFFLLGLNLLGVFEIGTRWMGLGSSWAGREGYPGSFFTGVLATAVATPCTAPFMGAAIGYALAQSAPVALGVFTALALGMLLPYLVLAFSPALLSRIPKPGRWMESLKQFLSFPLFLTAVWLVWTLGVQVGVDAIAWVLGGFVISAMGIWIIQRWPGNRGLGAGLLALVIGLALSLDSASGGREGSEGIDWQPWSQSVEDRLREAGNPVFVDYTAAWCITCQVNKRVAFADPEVIEAFGRLRIQALRADWTSYDPEITRALNALGRSGVPVYALYSPGAKTPVLLPEVLTPGLVLSELERAFPGTEGE